MYHDAADRLRVVDRRSCLYFPASPTTHACDPERPPAYERRSAFEEYRYDALGRRVLVRTRSEFACQQYCLNALRRIVWDGDQVLYEISAPGGSGATAARMEADTGLAVPFFLNQQHTAVEGFFPYGRVMYEHGGGIDAPLGVVRMEYSSELRDPQVIVPHSNWRGSYDRGTPIVGQCILFSSNGTQLAPPPDSTPSSGDQYGGVVGGGTYGGTKEHCLEVDWPASYTWSARQYRRGYAGPSSWMGSLIFESRDASGLYYRRNRYYDSEKGRFTQEDPIGLAGGMNVYGFADGDPISYSDPYGLCIWLWVKRCRDTSSRVTFGDVMYSGMRLWNVGLIMDMGFVRDQAQMLIAERRRDWGRGSLGAARANAFRHIFGACYLTLARGQRQARRILRAHETTLRSGSAAQAQDSRTDKMNNEIGILGAEHVEERETDTAQAYADARTCARVADSRIASGTYSGEGGYEDTQQ